MAIPGQTNINIGAENQSAGSDSLYQAFHTIQNNFTSLFNTASPYNTFNAGAGIDAYSDSANGKVTITNTGVIAITAGSGITIANTSGNVTISATANGPVGVTNVAVHSNTLAISGSPIISAGTINVNMPLVETITAGNYIAPNVSVDEYGRIIAISNGSSLGTVTSVTVQASGNGISVASGTVTSNGVITLTNTGVTSVRAGSGIQLSGSTGDVTISSRIDPNSFVSRVNITSNSLVVTGGAITTNGTINVELPDDFILGNLQLEHLTTTSDVSVGGNINITGNSNLGVTVNGQYFYGNTLSLTGNANIGNVAGAKSFIGNSITISGNSSLGNVSANYFAGNGLSITNGNSTLGNVATANYFAGVLTTNAQPNITAVGILANLTVGNSTSNTVFGNGTITTSGNISAGNITLTTKVTTGNLVVGNATQGNLTTFNANVANLLSVTGGLALMTSDNKPVYLQANPTITGSLLLFTLPSTQGTAGQHLTLNDSLGTMKWASPASSSIPASATAAGTAGMIAYDTSYFYVCVATNTWKRTALSTW